MLLPVSCQAGLFLAGEGALPNASLWVTLWGYPKEQTPPVYYFAGELVEAEFERRVTAGGEALSGAGSPAALAQDDRLLTSSELYL